jgi:hypothetical protein
MNPCVLPFSRGIMNHDSFGCSWLFSNQSPIPASPSRTTTRVAMRGLLLGTALLGLASTSVAFHALPLSAATTTRSSRNIHSPSSRPALRLHSSASSATASTTNEDKVSALLNLVKDTDGGASVKPEKREEIHSLIQGLINSPESQQADWLNDERVFDNYVVSYASSGEDRPKNSGSPAGGRFRGGLGRLLFRTTGLYQHIVKPNNEVINMVKFRLFSFLSGCVTLSGTFQPAPGPNGEKNFVKAVFRRPRIIFGPIVFEVGPESSVMLSVGYMDDKVRLGRGGQGSLFVFARGGDANSEAAAEWKKHVVAKPVSGRKTGIALLFAGAAIALRTSTWYWAVPFFMLGLPLGFGNGGMVGPQDPNIAPGQAPTTTSSTTTTSPPPAPTPAALS